MEERYTITRMAEDLEDLLQAAEGLVGWLNGVGLTNKIRRNRVPRQLLEVLESEIEKCRRHQ